MGFEFNGMRLHEYYFDNLVERHLSRNHLRWPRSWTTLSGPRDWMKDFKATGSMRGIGWAILYHDVLTGGLFNQWINEHETGHLAGCKPLLVMDVFEHAFMIDYGLKRPTTLRLSSTTCNGRQ